MSDPYLAYPHLERISSSGDARLPTPRVLLLWYLAQGLAPLTTREKLFTAWSERGQHPGAWRRDLAAGAGRLWRKTAKRVRLFTAEQLHQRLRVELVAVPRPRGTLLLDLAAWERLRTEEHVRSFRIGPDGKTDPVSNDALADHLGCSPRTVQRQLQDLPDVQRVPQWLDLGELSAQQRGERRQTVAGPVYLQHHGGRVLRRLPDAFQFQHLAGSPGWRRTDQGLLLARQHTRLAGQGPGGGDLWIRPEETPDFTRAHARARMVVSEKLRSALRNVLVVPEA